MIAAARRSDGNVLAPVPAIVLVLLIGPILVGTLGTVLPAFGYLPALGKTTWSLAPWRALFADPGFVTALRITLVTGFGATLGALVIAIGALAALHDTRLFDSLRLWLAPTLAFPFAGFAVGLAFLAAPSGLIARLLSPWATGWQVPPDLLILGDPDGVALMVALALKECLFLILMLVAAEGQSQGGDALRSARAMGYGAARAWLIVMLPQLYRQMRLPIYAVLAASLASVDVAIVLGPTAPPPLAPLTLDWYGLFDAGDQMKAAAAALFQMLLAIGAVGIWWLGETAVAALCRPILSLGRRHGTIERLLGGIGVMGVGAALAASLGALLVLTLWSFAGRWAWPGALPQHWSLAAWQASRPMLLPLVGNTLIVATTTSIVAVIAAVLSLEAGIGRIPKARMWILYLPLLLPQIGFLLGLQLVWIRLRMDGTLAAVAITHFLFVLPYVLLVLSEPYRALDPGIAITARTLGAGQLRTLWRIKLPLLLRPVAVAAAVGFAVSVGQYLPTVFAGAGRVDTLATEAVALASGADRRLAGVVALALTMLPFAALFAALIVPGDRAGIRRTAA